MLTSVRCIADEGSGKVQTIVSIGDKGRAQLTRALPALYAMGIADTYKAKVTFNQVGYVVYICLAYVVGILIYLHVKGDTDVVHA